GALLIALAGAWSLSAVGAGALCCSAVKACLSEEMRDSAVRDACSFGRYPMNTAAPTTITHAAAAPHRKTGQRSHELPMLRLTACGDMVAGGTAASARTWRHKAHWPR